MLLVYGISLRNTTARKLEFTLPQNYQLHGSKNHESEDKGADVAAVLRQGHPHCPQGKVPFKSLQNNFISVTS